MVIDNLLKEVKDLTDDQMVLLVNIAKFMKQTNSKSGNKKLQPIGYREDGTPFYRRAGLYKGKGWLADDFDEPLDDFKEYME